MYLYVSGHGVQIFGVTKYKVTFYHNETILYIRCNSVAMHNCIAVEKQESYN